MHKKGSLNLSINAVVIIVLAMTLLGLLLGFIKGQVAGIDETASTVQEQVRNSILDDLRSSNKKLSFPATTINLEKGDSKDIAIGVRNVNPVGELEYTLSVSVTKAQDSLTVTDEDAGKQVGFFYDESSFKLGVTEARVHPIKIKATGITNTYLAKLTITDKANSVVYDEKTFFVTII